MIPQLADADEVLAAIDATGGRRLLGADPQRARARARACAARPLRRDQRLPLRVGEPQPQQRQPLDRRVARRPRSARSRGARGRGTSLRGRDLGLLRLSLRGRGRPGPRVRDRRALAEAGCEEVSFGDTTGMANPRQVGEFFAERDRAARRRRAARPTSTTPAARAWPTCWPRSSRASSSFESAFGELGGSPLTPGATGNISTEDLVSMLAGDGRRDRSRPRASYRRLTGRTGAAGPPARRPRPAGRARSTGGDRAARMLKSDAFRAAVEAEDPEALTEALADDVVFRSPAVFKAVRGQAGGLGDPDRGRDEGVRGLPLHRAARGRRRRPLIFRRASATASSTASTCCGSTATGRSAS